MEQLHSWRGKGAKNTWRPGDEPGMQLRAGGRAGSRGGIAGRSYCCCFWPAGAGHKTAVKRVALSRHGTRRNRADAFGLDSLTGSRGRGQEAAARAAAPRRLDFCLYEGVAGAWLLPRLPLPGRRRTVRVAAVTQAPPTCFFPSGLQVPGWPRGRGVEGRACE